MVDEDLPSNICNRMLMPSVMVALLVLDRERPLPQQFSYEKHSQMSQWSLGANSTSVGGSAESGACQCLPLLV